MIQQKKKIKKLDIHLNITLMNNLKTKNVNNLI